MLQETRHAALAGKAYCAHFAVAQGQLAAPEQCLKLMLALHSSHLHPLVVLSPQQARHIHVQEGLCGAACRAAGLS